MRVNDTPHSVLVVDDDRAVGLVLAGLLEQAGMQATHVDRPSLALSMVRRARPDLVVTDLRMPEMDGLALLAALRREHAATPVVLLTAHGDVATAVEAMKRGATDFVTKPFDREQVLAVVRKALACAPAASPPVASPPAAPELLGDSASLAEVRRLIGRAASSNATVLVRGESGTGKELVARAIHRASPRRDGPFIALHCAAIPEELLESELFGYERGAFTGANVRKPGRVELAEHGTLFLDEIGDVSLATQVKLLRLLQERCYQPLGATRELRADVRFIAATHRDLEAMVTAGQFREDLFYRLDVLPIGVPPLRQRGADVVTLAQGLCARIAAAEGRPQLRFTGPALDRLTHYHWPGNVRELHSMVERLVVFAEGSAIADEEVERELARKLGRGAGGARPAAHGDELSMSARRSDAEQRAVLEALERAGGNRVKAAQLLGVSRRTLYNRLTRSAKSA